MMTTTKTRPVNVTPVRIPASVPPGGEGGSPPSGGGGGGVLPPPSPALRPFAPSPAQAYAAAFIAYSQRTGILLFNQAIEALPVAFDVEESSLLTFIELLYDCANICGGVLMLLHK